MQPQQPAPRFDPQTGQPLLPPEAYIQQPVAGQPLPQQPQQPQPIYQQQPVQPGQVPVGYPQQPTAAPTLQPFGQPAAPTAQPQSYDFIMNPNEAPKKAAVPIPGLPANPMIRRVALVGVGLVVLLIIGTIISKALNNSGSGDLTALTAVAQNQTELIHLVTNAGQQQGLSAANQAFNVTALPSLTSEQASLNTYLATNKYKIKPALLLTNAKLDTQLTTAAANSTYDATYQSIMQQQLTTYEQTLKHTYSVDKGAKARALLTADYNAAQLLLQLLTNS